MMYLVHAKENKQRKYQVLEPVNAGSDYPTICSLDPITPTEIY